MLRFRFQRYFLRKQVPLRISRGLIPSLENLFVFVEDDAGRLGIGEMIPGTDSQGSGIEDGERVLREFLDAPLEDRSITEVWQRARDFGVPPRALAALDTALWDLFGKVCGQPLHRVFGLPLPSNPTSVTLGIDRPRVLGERTRELLAQTDARVLKVKLGSEHGIEADQASFAAIRENTPPGVLLRVDANGAWSLKDAIAMDHWLAERKVELVEQPLPKGAEDQLGELYKHRRVPVIVDESCHFAEDVPALAPVVDGVNVKLMKTGGVTEAWRTVVAARACGLRNMIGCMSNSGVAISAGASLGALFDYIDLDSHLNLEYDPARPGPILEHGVVKPNGLPGHGAGFEPVAA
ncbi:MAG: dipeptide epimerase [Kiritimatiellaeota bacterium]|nr:dipeptide epimerase [Kiritimatiellota bacterium]